MESTEREMPIYNCHKQVWALKIKEVVMNPNDSIDLFFEEEGFASINIENSSKLPEPSAGWYYVVYKDGYKSFSPADAFEEGYTIA